MSARNHNKMLLEIIDTILGNEGWIKRSGLWINKCEDVFHVIGLEKRTWGSDNYNLKWGAIVRSESPKRTARLSRLDVTWNIRLRVSHLLPDVHDRHRILTAFDMDKKISRQERYADIEWMMRHAVIPVCKSNSTLDSLRDLCSNVKNPWRKCVDNVLNIKLKKVWEATCIHEIEAYRKKRSRQERRPKRLSP